MEIPADATRAPALEPGARAGVRRAMRSRFWLSLAVALCSTVAIIEWFDSNALAWRYLMSCAPVDCDYAAATALRWSIRVSRLAAILGLVGAIALVWRCRRDPLRPQLACGLLGLIALGVFLFVLAG
jgi:hypothetical protein